MSHKKMLLRLLYGIFVLLSFPVIAQVPDTITCADLAIYDLLEDINQYRVLEENLVPLALNQDLCDIAHAHVLSLSTLPENDIPFVDLQRRQDETNLTDWLDATNFQAYPDADNDPMYASDMRVFFTRRYDHRTIIDYLLTYELPTYGAFFADERFREIGLASLYSPALDAYFYTFIEGAQPNYLPVLAVERNAPYRIVDSLNNPEVTLVIHNENFAPDGHFLHVGQIGKIRVNLSSSANIPGQRLCNIAEGEGQPYSLYIIQQLEKRSGLHNLTIDMCDAQNNRMISMPVQFTLSLEPVSTDRECRNTLNDRLCSAMSGLEAGIVENLLLVFSEHNGYESFERCWMDNAGNIRYSAPTVVSVGLQMDGHIIIQSNVDAEAYCNTHSINDAFRGTEGVWLVPIAEVTLLQQANLPPAPDSATHIGLVRDSEGLLRYVFVVPEW